MATSVRFKLNHAGMQQLLQSGGIADMHRRAEAVASAARSSAPVEEGDYRDSIHVEDVVTDRAVSRVVAGVEYSPAVEADHGTLARALGSAG
jgi:predicted HAD superfamily Cof-like phosphohydrolase